MADYVKAAKVGDIAAGSLKTVVVKGKSIALANIDGNFFAVDDLCTHEECSLGTEGFLDGNLVTCGCHGSVFDVTSGKVKAMPATTDLSSYPVKVEGEDILIQA